jgi:hypothetical protein
MSNRWLWAAIAAAIAFALAAPAGAQANKAAKQNEKKARASFNAAVEKFDAGDFEGAVGLFREAYTLNPSWKLLYNIGQCEAARKRYGEALDVFEQYLSEGGDEVPADRREEVIAELKRLREMVGMIEIAAPDGAAVLVDGVPRGAAPLPGRIRVAAGVDHAVRIELDGAVLVDRSVRVGGGEELLVEAKPEPEAPAPVVAPAPAPAPADDGIAERNRKLRIAGWAAIGVGGAAVVAGVVTGALALSANRSVEDSCPGGECPAGQADEVDGRDRLARGTDVLLFAGAAIAATGVVLVAVFREKETSAEPAVAVAPVIVPNGGGAAAAWRF